MYLFFFPHHGDTKSDSNTQFNTKSDSNTQFNTKSDSNTQFNYPRGVAISAANNGTTAIFIAEYNNHRAQIFDGATHNYIATLGTTGSAGASNTQFNNPISVAISAADNRIYVAEYNNQCVQIFEWKILNGTAILAVPES